jgi:hypothetical protein
MGGARAGHYNHRQGLSMILGSVAPPPDDLEDELVQARERKRRAASFARQREMLGWPKARLFEHFLGLGAVELTFDPRPLIVRAPGSWKRQPHVAVDVSAATTVAHDTHGVMFEAVERGRKTRVVVPWSLVFSMIGDGVGGVVWQGDAPPELRAELEPTPLEPYIIMEIGGPDEAAGPESDEPSSR